MTGKSKWFSSIRSQGYRQKRSEAVQQMMFSIENSFTLGSLLYLAENRSEGICWCSSPIQQPLQTKTALSSKEHITVYRSRQKTPKSQDPLLSLLPAQCSYTAKFSAGLAASHPSGAE